MKSNLRADYEKSRSRRGVNFDEFARYSDPLNFADYEHWLTMPAWEGYECAILSIGSDPRKIRDKDFKGVGSAGSATVSAYKRVLNDPVRVQMHTLDSHAPNGISIAETITRLQKLDELLVRRAITEAEFDALKAKLLRAA